jgi:uncharacterized protein YndB with AHSA1/START domain
VLAHTFEDESMKRSALLLIVSLVGLMVSAHAAEPQVTEGFINAPVSEVWRLFTTSEGYKATGVAHADVDFRIGGAIRTHYDANGQLGDPNTIVNEILAYEPERMLAIRIKQAPASFPFKNAMRDTWTVIHLAAAGSMTQVRIVGLGYNDEPESQAMREFFAKGNRATLDHMAKPYWPKCKHCAIEGEGATDDGR